MFQKKKTHFFHTLDVLHITSRNIFQLVIFFGYFVVVVGITTEGDVTTTLVEDGLITIIGVTVTIESLFQGVIEVTEAK